MIPSERVEPGKGKAIALTVLMHVLLVGVLFLGVRWQNRAPEPVAVEVWRAVPAPAPSVEPPPEPKPEAKPEPKPEPEPPKKPDIAVKAEPAKKPAPQKPEVAKPEAAKPRFDEALKREMEQLDRQKALQEKQLRAEQEAQHARQLRDEQAAAAGRRGMLQYADKIKAKVRGNIVQPPELKGNPVALFVVTQLPTGEVIDVQKKRSSGIAAYDDAIDRAIRKSSPLPKPDDARLFQRQLELTFCPDEARGCR